MFSYTPTKALIINYESCSHNLIYRPIRVLYNLDYKQELKGVLKTNQNHIQQKEIKMNTRLYKIKIRK